MLRVPGSEPLGHQHFDGLFEQLRAHVSEQAFGLRVHQNDLSRAVDNNHGVGRGFQQSAEFLLGLLALGDVPNGAHCQRALLRFQGAETDFHGKLCSILAQAVQLQARTHGTRAWFGEKAGAVAGMVAAKTLRDQNLDFLAQEFFAGITE